MHIAKKRCLALVFLVILGFASYIGLQIATGNFHEIIPQEFYRSAQVGRNDILHYQQQYGIKTILNLRGKHVGEPWYDEEIAASKEAGITHIDFPMAAKEEVSNEKAIALIKVMRDAPKPLLVHCRSGADRTGLASALYLAAISGKTEWAAERQLWMHYGHVPFFISAAVAMNHTFERMEPYLGFYGS